jgi:hypothetical protein
MRSSKRKSREESSSAAESGDIRCVCGTTQDIEDTEESWLICDSCECRQHSVCMGISIVGGKLPSHYNCELCSPDAHKELLGATARGINLWEDRRKLHTQKANEEGTPKYREKKARNSGKNRRQSVQDTSMDEADEADEAFVHEAVTVSFPLTDECHHYTSVREVPWDIQK